MIFKERVKEIIFKERVKVAPTIAFFFSEIQPEKVLWEEETRDQTRLGEMAGAEAQGNG